MNEIINEKFNVIMNSISELKTILDNSSKKIEIRDIRYDPTNCPIESMPHLQYIFSHHKYRSVKDWKIIGNTLIHKNLVLSDYIIKNSKFEGGVIEENVEINGPITISNGVIICSDTRLCGENILTGNITINGGKITNSSIINETESFINIGTQRDCPNYKSLNAKCCIIASTIKLLNKNIKKVPINLVGFIELDQFNLHIDDNTSFINIVTNYTMTHIHKSSFINGGITLMDSKTCFPKNPIEKFYKEIFCCELNNSLIEIKSNEYFRLASIKDSGFLLRIFPDHPF